jgi:hypothetical protein
MNLKNWFLVVMALWFTTSCATSQEIRIIEEPPEKMYFDGFSLLTPNERGWLYTKSERAERGLIAHRQKDGVGVNFLETAFAEWDENYFIRAIIFAFPNFEKDEDFLEFVKEKLINNQYRARINMLERHQKPFKADGKNCIQDYFRGKDLKAKKSSGNTDPMILEVMNFICHHPSENAGLVFTYSYRYYSKNKDPDLKEKALAVLKNIEYSEISEESKKNFKYLVEKHFDGLIDLIKETYFTV